MANDRNENQQRDDANQNDMEPVRNRNSDLQDSPRDAERLRGEEATIDMPEVKDIPGQEHVKVPRIGEMADTTISSADEEGDGVLDELNQGEEDDDVIKMGTEADVNKTDVEMLRSGDSYYPSKDEDQLVNASMDNTDFEGDALNERGFGLTNRTGKDLDVPGEAADDRMEDIGEEDEENNEYSLGSDENDDSESGRQS
jgi:hypothetical protein